MGLSSRHLVRAGKDAAELAAMADGDAEVHGPDNQWNASSGAIDHAR